MDSNTLASRIRLHPRAVVLLGTLEARMKMGGNLPGLTPHYAKEGCPVVQFRDGEALPEPSGAEIEMQVQETDFPLDKARQAYSPRQANLVQLMYGREGKAATAAEYRILREASVKLGALVADRQPVYLAALPLLTPGKFGVTNARLFFLGVFSAEGQPLYLNPDAVDGAVLRAHYPKDQRERTTSDQPRVATWYGELSSALASVVKPDELHDQVIQARVRYLVQQGLTEEQATAKAQEEAPRKKAATPATAAAPAKESAPAAPTKEQERPSGPSSQQKTGERLMTAAAAAAPAKEQAGPTSAKDAGPSGPARGDRPMK